MRIITDECLGCASFNKCGTEVVKGSMMCAILRSKNNQTKGDMLCKMAEIAKIAADSKK